jgi:hypothetical protein
VIDADTCTQALLLLQVRASTVLVVAVVLSRSVAVAQSYVTVSGQSTSYQKVRWLEPDGAVNVCAIDESPLAGVLVETRPDSTVGRGTCA